MNRKVCVVGNLNIDLILMSLKTLPEWGTEALVEDLNIRTAGQVGYLALALSKLGINTSVIANVGKDHFGREILSQLEKEEVNCGGIDIVKTHPTGVTVAIVNKSGERVLISYPGSMEILGESLVIEHWNLVKETNILFLCGYFLLPNLSFAGTEKILTRAKKEGKMTFLDTGWDPENWTNEKKKEIRELLKQVDAFLPNREEATVLTGKDSPEEMIKELYSWGPSHIIIKLGENGSFAKTKEGLFYGPSFHTKIFDTTGAGDVFNAGVIYGLFRNWKMVRTLKFANTLSSIFISRKNDKYPTVDEVQSRMGSD